MAGERRPLFLFDSDCGICTRLMGVASFLDASHSVGFLPISEAAEQGLLESVDRARWYSSSHFVHPDGAISSGGDSIVDLVYHLPGGRVPAVLISRAPMGLATARKAYRILSRLHGSSCAAKHPDSNPMAAMTGAISL